MQKRAGRRASMYACVSGEFLRPMLVRVLLVLLLLPMPLSVRRLLQDR